LSRKFNKNFIRDLGGILGRNLGRIHHQETELCVKLRKPRNFNKSIDKKIKRVYLYICALQKHSNKHNPFGGIPERPKGADCKSVVRDFDGSNPSPSTKTNKNGTYAKSLALQGFLTF
jgi:hypothetical protein